MYTDLGGVQRLAGTSYDVQVLKDGLPNEQIYSFYSVDSANQKLLLVQHSLNMTKAFILDTIQ